MDQGEELLAQLGSDVNGQTKGLEGEALSWTQDLEAEPGKVGLQSANRLAASRPSRNPRPGQGARPDFQ